MYPLNSVTLAAIVVVALVASRGAILALDAFESAESCPSIRFEERDASAGAAYVVTSVADGPYSLDTIWYSFHPADQNTAPPGRYVEGGPWDFEKPDHPDSGLSYEDRTDPPDELNEADRFVVHSNATYGLDIFNEEGRGIGGTRSCSDMVPNVSPAPDCQPETEDQGCA